MKRKTDISFFGKSDVGCVRKNNEDAFVTQKLWDDKTILAVAIDGVGGYEGGEIAAAIAQKKIPEFLMASPNGERLDLLKQAVTAANNAIFEARESDPGHGQMSCVLTAAIIDLTLKQISMVHVGDTRLYSYRYGELTKLSHDHSIVGYREEVGDLTEEEAMHHPQRNVIGRDVGSQKHKASDEEFIEAQVFPLQPDTTLLFCSDGLTDMITSATIKSILSEDWTLERKTDALIQAALNAGGKDNVTVVLVDYRGGETAEKPISKPKEKPVIVTAGKGPDPEPEYKAEPAPAKRWVAPLVACVAGLLIGAAASFFFVNGRMNQFRKEWQGKEEAYADTLYMLRTALDRGESLARDSTRIWQLEALRHENDSLRVSLEAMEKKNEIIVEQIEKIHEFINPDTKE